MKIHWDDRGAEPITKSYYVTMKQAALMALRQVFEPKEMKKMKYEASISFVDDLEMQQMNLKFREKDAATDVLSFPIIGTPPNDIFPMGDIVISTETAERQAQEYGHSFEREMAFLAVHGMLHLLGFNHEEDPNDLAMMEEIQESILEELGLARGAASGGAE
jgi:probable rRNA maturation factor